MANTHKGAYYWIDDRLKIIEDVLLFAKNWPEAVIGIRKRGIRATSAAIQMQANIHHMPRPYINKGGYRHGVKNENIKKSL